MSSVLKRKEDVHFAEVGDEFYLTLENQDVVICMNSPAFLVLENLNGFTQTDEIINSICDRTDLKSSQVKSAVNKVLEVFLDNDVVEEVKQKKRMNKRILNIDTERVKGVLPEIYRVWNSKELAGGIFINRSDGDIHVIVPNVTDGPIKTCPPHTCTIPAGLFTAQTIIRFFNDDWKKNFQNIKHRGFVQLRK